MLLIAALASAAIPALAQDRPESILPPGFEEPPAPTPAPPAAGRPAAPPATGPAEGGAVEISDSLSIEELSSSAPPSRPTELPQWAERDPARVGPLDPVTIGLGEAPWGAASGEMLSVLLRRMDTPLASRWAHIGLRNALLAGAPTPFGRNPVDWAAERAWLLLRMGEADAARMLVSGVDVRLFTPKMFQVAAQSALANSDPSGLCPLETGIERTERRLMPMIRAMCASLAGESERAAADIEAARRRGSVGGIDLALADKLVGAGADTARAVTIEWEPVKSLNIWRYGLATATGMMPPERLMTSAAPRMQAWLARSPIFPAAQRIDAARTAAGLGVLSSEALVDIYAAAYDATEADALGESDAWKLRIAYVGKDRDARLGAMRSLWSAAKTPLDRMAAQVLTARAASLVVPDPALQSDAKALIASMLAAGYDRKAARWGEAVKRMDDEQADAAWAMLALAAPDARPLDISFGRIDAFAKRDKSPDKQRTALLIAGLAGLGRIDAQAAGRLSGRHGLDLAQRTGFTNLIDGASLRRQPGTALVLAAVGLQAEGFDKVPALYLFHAINALRRTGQDYAARMIAAEALART